MTGAPYSKKMLAAGDPPVMLPAMNATDKSALDSIMDSMDAGDGVWVQVLDAGFMDDASVRRFYVHSCTGDIFGTVYHRRCTRTTCFEVLGEDRDTFVMHHGAYFTKGGR